MNCCTLVVARRDAPDVNVQQEESYVYHFANVLVILIVNLLIIRLNICDRLLSDCEHISCIVLIFEPLVYTLSATFLGSPNSGYSDI